MMSLKEIKYYGLMCDLCGKIEKIENYAGTIGVKLPSNWAKISYNLPQKGRFRAAFTIHKCPTCEREKPSDAEILIPEDAININKEVY